MNRKRKSVTGLEDGSCLAAKEGFYMGWAIFWGNRRPED
jgi:hypothetical protein